MTLSNHRNPNGTFNGVSAMAELIGLPHTEIQAIAAQVKANHQKLAGCPWHEFEQLITAPPGNGKYRCRHCQGEVDASAYRWHQVGRRPMPVGEPQPVRKVGVGYPCHGGPLDGQMLAYDHGSTYRVVMRPSAPCTPCAGLPPRNPEYAHVEYRLQPVGADQLVWVFQGWRE